MKPLARAHNLIVEKFGSERVVYDTETKKAHTLNPSVSWVWQRCDGKTSTDELASSFAREFGVDHSAAEIVDSALEQLAAAALLEEQATPVVTRRAVCAAGSALTPIITSVLVPTALAAKSGDRGQDDGKGRDDRGKGRNDQKGR